MRKKYHLQPFMFKPGMHKDLLNDIRQEYRLTQDKWTYVHEKLGIIPDSTLVPPSYPPGSLPSQFPSQPSFQAPQLPQPYPAYPSYQLPQSLPSFRSLLSVPSPFTTFPTPNPILPIINPNPPLTPFPFPLTPPLPTPPGLACYGPSHCAAYSEDSRGVHDPWKVLLYFLL
ncbi:hypothetical protein H1R20_g7674, partial [Candolleomyces eurysporus]